MTRTKRILDLALVILLSPALIVAIFAIGIGSALRDGRPVFYASARVKYPGKNFRLWKFRTMLEAGKDAGASGGDKTHRITSTGRFLRRYRLDELPQIWNILRGEMSFVGPRPPLPEYVEAYPELYRQVLQARPGVTGMATLAYHRTEAQLLATCTTPKETDALYRRRCIPRKARLDLLYGTNATLCSDLSLMVATVLGRKVPWRNKRARPHTGS